MGNQNIVLWSIFIGVIIFLITFFRSLKANQDEIKKIIEEKFPETVIQMQDPHALHLAQQSWGRRQFRGNGNLILTDTELFFAMPIPKKIISIPLSSISKIETPVRFQAKSIAKPLLKVNFKTETGEEDAIAWYVKELSRWAREIESRITHDG